MVMINRIYAEDKQRLFTDREKELALIGASVDSFIKGGARKHLALIGLRRVGKSLTVFEFIKRNKEDILLMHIDLKKASMDPYFFAQEYVRKTLQWVLDDEEEDILVLANRLGKEEFFKSIRAFLQELKERNYPQAIGFALGFPERLSREFGKKIIVCIDEFQDILGMDNYPGVGDILSMFRTALQSQSNTLYIVTGSVITTMDNICTDNGSALFLQFRNITLHDFTKEDTSSLIRKIFRTEGMAPPEAPIILTAFRLSQGHPFYATAIVEKAIELNKLYEYEMDEGLVRRAYVLELTNKGSTLYNYFNYIFENSLERARGKGGLKSILLSISKEGALTVSELSSLLSKKDGEIRTLLKRLIETDLIVQEGRQYRFRDPLLSQWLRIFYLGLDIGEQTKGERIDEVLSRLEEKYVRASTELGRAKEYEWRVRLEERFGVKLQNYCKGGIEFDLVGKKDDQWLIFEVKHRNRSSTYKDVKHFLDKVAESEFGDQKRTLCFISKSGFTAEARKLASDKVELLEA